MKTQTVKLPIASIEELLMKNLISNDIIFISTPTSSGKTMFVPQLCAKLSGKQVWCSQPRVILCREAQKGANKLFFKNTPDSGAAFATGRGDSSNLRFAQVIYATEGSIIARKIWEKLSKGSFLIVDEVHEQGIGVEKIIALTNKFIDKGIKVVFMSATMDLEKYISYFSNMNISVGKVEMQPTERAYPIEYRIVSDPIAEIVRVVEMGGRGLIGVEGKETIEKISKEIQKINNNIEVFPIHGDLDIEEQDEALKYKDSAIYIATNIAQSGITIDNISCGWFNGFGNEIRNVNGCPTLVRYELSQAEMKQWFGRLGRTCAGVIFQTPKEVENFSKRNPNPTPEILRVPLLDTVLDFAGIGLDLETTNLLNKPKQKEIKTSKHILKKLMCLDNKDQLTEFGQQVVQYNVGVRMGIVKHKAKELGNALLGDQIAAINRYGSPLKFVKNQSTINKIVSKYSSPSMRFSGYMVAIDTIEYFITQYGNKVSNMDWPLFSKECDDWGISEKGFVKGGIHKKTLLALMKAFGQFETKNEKPVLPDNVKKIMKAAYADQIIDYGQVCEEHMDLDNIYACPILGDNYCRMVGDIVQINTGKRPIALVEIATCID